MTQLLVVLALATAMPLARAEVAAVDDTGVTVRLVAPATRIVTLAPHATELLFAIGAGPRIVGTLDTSDFPSASESRSARRRRTRARPRTHRRARPRPDRHLAVDRACAGRVAARARHRRLHDEAGDDRRHRAGHGAPGRADRTHGGGRGARQRHSARASRDCVPATRAAPRVRVFYEIWDAPLYTVGGAHLITQATHGVRRRERLRRADAARAGGRRGGRAGREAGGDHRRRRTWCAPRVARPLAALDGAPGRRDRAPFRRRCRPPAPARAALSRRRRAVVCSRRQGSSVRLASVNIRQPAAARLRRAAPGMREEWARASSAVA